VPAAAVIALLVFAGTAHAATLTVTKLTDSLDGTCDADCSLREAIHRANLDGTQDVIQLPSGALRVDLAGAPGMPEDLNVSGDLDVTQDVIIRGSGPQATSITALLPVDAQDRVLDQLGTGTDLQLTDLTIAGGVGLYYGGGVRSSADGELRLDRVIVRDNTAYGQAALGYGGGVYKATGRLALRDVAIHGNRGTAPGYGGGLFLNSLGTSASLLNVTITGNSASTGGGIFSNNSIVGELTHVTVSGNEASGQVGGIGGDAASLRLRSSVVAANTAPTDANCSSSGYAPASDGGNVGDPVCGLTQASDVPIVDARLGLLGGAPIPVMEPAANSAAIDRAIGPCPPADARGIARPQGPACDSGAAERPVPAAPPVADATAPVLSRLSLSARRFSVGRRPTPLAAQRGRTPVGTVVRYSLSEPATVRLRIERAAGGRRAGGRCRKATRRLRKRPRCTRYIRAGRAITRAAPAGASRLSFSGRIGRKPLRPARYRARVSAVDAAMNASAARSLRFRIVRARPRG
jgi:CSLREA domain-containing protein